MKNNVPYDVAMDMPDDERVAHAIIFGQLDGGQFDWNQFRFVERRS